MNQKNPTWDPTIPDQNVRLRQNPGKRGHTTGRTRYAGTRRLVQVDFGSHDVGYRDYDLLEPCPQHLEPIQEFRRGSLGTMADLRKRLVFEKIRGKLTNVFYSMESSNTTFYPHQFKPVLKFIESPVGRLLIADEVGLGKTIEAGYVWKELNARENAGRLLVVCPAILREKWRDDLLKKFSIHADLLDAKDLLRRVRVYLDQRVPSEFVCVCSMQGLRPPRNFADNAVRGPRAELARILEANVASENNPLFDLVIIDEAHYMRNSGTQTNLLGQLLRDSSRYFLLLTATPIQIDNDNLFQLLRLVSPEDFSNRLMFDDIMEANKPVTRALRSLWKTHSDYVNAASAVEESLGLRHFKNNAALRRVLAELKELKKGNGNDRDKKIKLGYILEDVSLLGHYMSRSRKRDIPESRVRRSPQVLKVTFSSSEKKIYELVTGHIRERSKGLGGARFFSEIARQTQMASCMVAALKSWDSKGFLDEVLGEGLGIHDLASGGEENLEPGGPTDSIAEWPFPTGAVDFDALEKEDSKYRVFIEFLQKELHRNPAEKFVVFSFFRGTLGYLDERLRKDGISSVMIMGGMGEEKWRILNRFRESKSCNVLLSSEVGSEGIDLQFCRFLVNYDLPWNPMRVEQRIGRLDRLGQTAERITIVNLSLADTVEGRILDRLYERIQLFEESIGDMEEILGDMTEQILTELFNPTLSDREREVNADKIADAIRKKRQDQDRLEGEAINLVAFSDYVLDSIKETRNAGRWLKPADVMRLAQDFLVPRYLGTELRKSDRFEGAMKVRLSENARLELGQFMQQNRIVTGTRLHQKTNAFVECLFDPRQSEDLGSGTELVDPTHPLIRWIRHTYEMGKETFQPAVAIKLPVSAAGVPPGTYGVVVQKWTFDGMRSERRLVFAARRRAGEETLNNSISESLVNAAILKGGPWENAWNLMPDKNEIIGMVERIEEDLSARFGEESENFKSDNENFCDIQETGARRFAERRIDMLEERIHNFRLSNPKMIPATEGLIRKERAVLSEKQKHIEKRRIVDYSEATLCVGVISIE